MVEQIRYHYNPEVNQIIIYFKELENYLNQFILNNLKTNIIGDGTILNDTIPFLEKSNEEFEKNIIKIINSTQFPAFKTTLYIWLDEFQTNYKLRIVSLKVNSKSHKKNTFGGKQRFVGLNKIQLNNLDSDSISEEDTLRNPQEILLEILIFLQSEEENIVKRLQAVL